MTGYIGRFGGSSRPADMQRWTEVSTNGWSLLALMADRLAAAGVSINELRILEVLDAMREAGISEIAARTHIQVSTVSRQVTRLIAVGSVERAPAGSDARHRVVRLTDDGRTALAGCRAIRDALVRKHVVDVLEADEYLSLAQAFKKIGDSI